MGSDRDSSGEGWGKAAAANFLASVVRQLSTIPDVAFILKGETPVVETAPEPPRDEMPVRADGPFMAKRYIDGLRSDFLESEKPGVNLPPVKDLLEAVDADAKNYNATDSDRVAARSLVKGMWHVCRMKNLTDAKSIKELRKEVAADVQLSQGTRERVLLRIDEVLSKLESARQ